MQIALAPFQLKPGVTEEALLAASEAFQTGFVQRQDGIVRRVLVRKPSGGYADLVFFESEEAMEKVVAAEQDDEACARFSSIVEDGDHSTFEVLRTYE
jgi:hypothetical protein